MMDPEQHEEHLANIEAAEEVVAVQTVKTHHSVAWWLSIAAGLIAAGALIIAIVASFTIRALDSQLKDAKILQEANRIETTCRAGTTADLDIARANLDVVEGQISSYSSDYDIAFNDLITLYVVPVGQRDAAAIQAVQDRITADAKGEDGLRPQLPALIKDVSDAAAARKRSVQGCIQAPVPTPETPNS